MFEGHPTARADMKPGTLYAIKGQRDWIYYGQVTPEKSVGFFRHRDRGVADVSAVLSGSIMSVITVAYPSITRALRAGLWEKLGHYELVPALQTPRPIVQWPVGTLEVTVCACGSQAYQTRVDDPAIQDCELMAVWDAEFQLPARLTADFGAEESEWHIGGPIWRQRKVKEEMAARSPDQPWHALPADWVPTDGR